MNRFGQKMQVEDRLLGMAAGQLKGAVNSKEYQQQNSSSHMADCFRMGVFSDNLPPSIAPSVVDQMPAYEPQGYTENQAPIAMEHEY